MKIFLSLNKTDKIFKNISMRNQYIPGVVVKTTTNSMGLSLQPLQIETLQVVPVKSVGVTERDTDTRHTHRAGRHSGMGKVQSIIPGWASPEKLTPAGEFKTDFEAYVNSLLHIQHQKPIHTKLLDTSLQKVAVHLWMSKTEILNPWAKACSSCNWHRPVVNFGNIWTQQKWHVLNPLPNRYETPPPITRLIMCCDSAYRLFQ